MPQRVSRTIAGAAATLVVASSVLASSAFSQTAPSELTASARRALLDQYCVTCHNERLRTADLTLDTLDVDNVGRAPDVWERAVRKLRAGVMPPLPRPRPDGEHRSS